MINVNLDSVNEISNGPVPGGYVSMIMQVDHVEEKSYIKLYLDIAEGEFANYYEDLFDSRTFWGLTNIRSYKPKALPFFKQMITSVTKSNEDFKWDGDEQKLVGKLVGIILKNEQYTKNDGTLGMRLVVDRFTSAENIRKGNFKVPETKYIETADVKFSPTKADHITTSNGRLSGFMQVKEDNEEGIPFV